MCSVCVSPPFHKNCRNSYEALSCWNISLKEPEVFNQNGCEEQIVVLEAKLFDISAPKINIENQLKTAVNVLLKLDLLYKNGGIALKREIIGSIFPEKLSFDGREHRTARVNEVVSIICMVSSELEDKKKWANDVKTCLPTRVDHNGLEPPIKRIKFPDWLF